jgi:hypothetical protein
MQKGFSEMKPDKNHPWRRTFNFKRDRAEVDYRSFINEGVNHTIGSNKSRNLDKYYRGKISN